MANRKTKEDSLDNVFDNFDFDEVDLKKDDELDASKEDLEKEVAALKAQLEEERQKNNIEKETKKMAHKGGVFKAVRTTTYNGRTIIAGDTIKIAKTEVSNRNLLKIGEFSIDSGFEEELNGTVRDLKIVDDVIEESYARMGK